MVDMTALAQLLTDDSNPPRFRQGQIQSVAANGTVTVTVRGGTTQLAGVRVASNTCPLPGASCWLVTDGLDWMVWSTLAPAGPAAAFMRQASAQTIPNGTTTAYSWSSRTDLTAVGCTLGSNGITIGVPGLYQVTIAPLLAGFVPITSVRLLQNGVAAQNSPAAIMRLTIGDVINADLTQYYGTDAATGIGSGANVLRATWLGPIA